MKERNGWVSNSSSSSFVIAGYSLSDEQQEELLEKLDYEDLYDYVDANDADNYLVSDDYTFCYGKILGYGEDYDFSCESISLEKILEDVKKAVDKLPELKEYIENNKLEVKVHGGIVAS